MGRVAAGNDIKLIKAGVNLARAKGLSGFTVREVCSKSKVNLGMFHYYFESKDNFDMAVLKSIYAVMMESININVSASKTPKENVSAILFEIQDFIQKNRVLLSSLAGDVFCGNKKIIKFIAENFTQHVSILIKELKRAAKEGSLAVPGVTDAILILLPPVALPQIVLGLLARLDVALPAGLTPSIAGLMFEAGVKTRINILLNTVFKG